MELREFRGADSVPPRLSINGTEIPPTVIDWKSPDVGETLRDDSRNLTELPSLKIARTFNVEIGSPLEPAALELSIFRGGMSEIDPAGSPDDVVDLETSGLVVKRKSSGERAYSIDRSSASITGSVVIGIFVQYYADPTLSQERFTNSIGWVFSLDP